MPPPHMVDFGLNQAQEQRALRLHRECLIIDGMNQHPGGSRIYDELPADWVSSKLEGLESVHKLGVASTLPYAACEEGISDIVRQWWQESGVDVGVYAVQVNPGAFEGEFDDDIVERLDWIGKVTTAEQIRSNKAAGKISLFGVDQPVMGIPNRIGSVEDAYERGLRSLMLTYNRMDFVGCGCTERYDAGLSMYGLEVVAKCNELGIIVDTSHCGHQTTMDACRFSKTPVTANHACARGVYEHARGKQDEALRALADSGGVIGVVTVPFFVSGEPRPGIEAVLDHIDYIANLVGIEHVGIGTDWPMQCPKDVLVETLGSFVGTIGFRPQDQLDCTATIAGFDDYREFINITRGLVARGYSDQDIAKILGENFLRVIEQVC